MKIKTQRTLLLLAIAFYSLKASAQENLITMRVIDNLTKKPVRDATIYLNNSTTFLTNHLGFSQFTAVNGDTIWISSQDYAEKFIIIPSVEKFQVGLDLDESKLDFAGGISKFYNYWASNLRYPSKARSKKIQANLLVEFEIDSTGQSRLVQIHNDVEDLFEQTVTDVFKTMEGKWSVNYATRKFVLPIKFKMAESIPLEDIRSTEILADRFLKEIVVVGY